MPIKKCKICGKKFYARPGYIKQGWGKYCSKGCQYEGYKTGRLVNCATCGKKIYKSQKELKHSKSKKYFCNKSCFAILKNKQRKGKKKSKLLKKLWGSWCNSSIRVCGTLGEGAHPSGPPLFTFFFKFLKFKKKAKSLFLKRPPKKTLYNLYWKKNYTQTEIGKIFNATHTSVERWFNCYKIPIKPRTLSCGHNPNTIKNLELGRTEEAEKKSAEARRIYTKEKLIRKIKEFVERHGRIPTKNEFVHDPSYPDYVTYRDYFGTWNNAVKAAGYEPNESWFTTRDLFAKDGHECNSISEIIIDDWLFENHIPHLREHLYPEGRYRCDFVVGNIFIEFFGLFNALDIDPNYLGIIKRKKEICKKFNIPFLELYEKDLYRLDQMLGQKLGLKLKQKALF